MPEDIITEKSKIRAQLADFKRDGKLDHDRVLEELWVEQVFQSRRLDSGSAVMGQLKDGQQCMKDGLEDAKRERDDIKKKLNRCPVMKGEKTFSQVHPPAPRQDPDAPADTLRVQGRVKMKTIILIIITIALIAIPGGIVWFLEKGGG